MESVNTGEYDGKKPRIHGGFVWWGSILNGFDKACITEAVKSANGVFERIENPFAEKRANKM